MRKNPDAASADYTYLGYKAFQWSNQNGGAMTNEFLTGMFQLLVNFFLRV